MALEVESEFTADETEQRNFRGQGCVNCSKQGIISQLQFEKCINLSHEFLTAVSSWPLSLTVRY